MKDRPYSREEFERRRPALRRWPSRSVCRERPEDSILRSRPVGPHLRIRAPGSGRRGIVRVREGKRVSVSAPVGDGPGVSFVSRSRRSPIAESVELRLDDLSATSLSSISRECRSSRSPRTSAEESGPAPARCHERADPRRGAPGAARGRGTGQPARVRVPRGRERRYASSGRGPARPPRARCATCPERVAARDRRDRLVSLGAARTTRSTITWPRSSPPSRPGRRRSATTSITTSRALAAGHGGGLDLRSGAATVHLHTASVDGKMTPRAAPRASRRAGDAYAFLTDHAPDAPTGPAPMARRLRADFEADIDRCSTSARSAAESRAICSWAESEHRRGRHARRHPEARPVPRRRDRVGAHELDPRDHDLGGLDARSRQSTPAVLGHAADGSTRCARASGPTGPACSRGLAIWASPSRSTAAPSAST